VTVKLRERLAHTDQWSLGLYVSGRYFQRLIGQSYKSRVITSTCISCYCFLQLLPRPGDSRHGFVFGRLSFFVCHHCYIMGKRLRQWYTSPYTWSRSVVLVLGWTDWLAEIWGVFAMMRYTNLPLLYFYFTLHRYIVVKLP